MKKKKLKNSDEKKVKKEKSKDFSKDDIYVDCTNNLSEIFEIFNKHDC